MDKLQKLTSILLRLKSESPEFFKRFQPYAWIGTLVTFVTTLLSILEVYTLPDKWEVAIGVISAVFFGSAITSHLPVKSYDDGKDDDGPGPGGEPVKPPTKP